jgi:hypothetical protein
MATYEGSKCCLSQKSKIWEDKLSNLIPKGVLQESSIIIYLSFTERLLIFYTIVNISISQQE